MSDNGHAANSAWKIDFSTEGVRRVRNTSRTDGVPALPMEKKLTQVFAGLAGGALLLGDEFSSSVIESKAEELAYGWALLAQENDTVHTAISWLLETSAWGEAIVPTAMVGGMIAWHYGLLPDKFGYPLSQISGVAPLSREQEMELRRRAQAQAAAETEREVQDALDEDEDAEAPGTEPINADASVSSVIEVPDDLGD